MIECQYPTKEGEKCKRSWKHYAAGMYLCSIHLDKIKDWNQEGGIIITKREAE